MKHDQLQHVKSQLQVAGFHVLDLERSRGELRQSFAQKTAEADELKTRVKELETSLTTTRALFKTLEEQLAESRSAQETQEIVRDLL